MALCECGCNAEVQLNWRGRPNRFITGHNARGNVRKARVTVVCRHCGAGVPMTAAAAAGRTFCSGACRDAFRATRKGPLNPAYTSIESACSICGAAFVAQPARLAKGQTYCSAACGREGRRRKIVGTLRKKVPSKSLDAGKKQAGERDGYRCRVCAFEHFIHVHHIVPRRCGGSHDPGNLICLCPNHHGMAHAGMLTAAELLALLAEPREDAPPRRTTLNYRADPAGPAAS